MTHFTVWSVLLAGAGCGADGHGIKGGSEPGDTDAGGHDCVFQDDGPLLELSEDEVDDSLEEALVAAEAMVGVYDYACTPVDWTSEVTLTVTLGEIDRAALNQYTGVGDWCTANDRWLVGSVSGGLETSLGDDWRYSFVTVSPLTADRFLGLRTAPSAGSRSVADVWWRLDGSAGGTVTWKEEDERCDFTAPAPA